MDPRLLDLGCVQREERLGDRIVLLGAVALGWAARRLDFPYAIALVIGGAAMGFVP